MLLFGVGDLKCLSGALYSLREDGQYRLLFDYQRANMKPIEVNHVDHDAMDLT
jgi:plasmid maintenance system killer protein